MPLLKVEDLGCDYGDGAVVEGLSFHVNQGEIVSLLGPSGCGKTTVLRAIAGFQPLRRGRIEIAGQPVSAVGLQVPPERRALGMVFQDYALFPHLTVADNILFGLGRTPAPERRRLLAAMVEAMDLAQLEHRYPHELSGGQQQRVALARALAPRPKLMLLDEPFSNLDVELRERLSIDVRDVLKDYGATAVLVTHDQHEAFAVSDKVGIMRRGRILQWDSPFNLYHEPASRFVADFIGQGVFISGTLVSPECFDTELGRLCGNRAFTEPAGTRMNLLLRPDDVVVGEQGQFIAKVVEKAFKGAETLYTLRLDSGTKLLSLAPSHTDFVVGNQVAVRIAADHLIGFPEEVQVDPEANRC